MINTSLNLSLTVLEIIATEAEKNNKSKRDIIVDLLKMMMFDKVPMPSRARAIRYQPDADKKKWHCFHLRLRADEYEYFTDLRKVYKCSISLLVTMAVEKFLNPTSYMGVDNNTSITHYFFGKEVIEGVICWHICWGFPKEYILNHLYGTALMTQNMKIPPCPV